MWAAIIVAVTLLGRPDRDVGGVGAAVGAGRARGRYRADPDRPPFAGEDTRKGLYKMPKAWIQNGAWGLLILAVTIGGHLMFAERQQVYGHDPTVATSTQDTGKKQKR